MRCEFIFSPELIQEKPYMYEVDCSAFFHSYELISLKKVFSFSRTILNLKIRNEIKPFDLLLFPEFF
jgi:hypothetical protein